MKNRDEEYPRERGTEVEDCKGCVKEVWGQVVLQSEYR